MSYPTQQQQFNGEKPHDGNQGGQAAGYYGGAPNVPDTYNSPNNYNQGPCGADRGYNGTPQGHYPPQGQPMNQGAQQPTVIYQQAPEKDHTGKLCGLAALCACCFCCCGPDEIDCC